MLHSELDIYKVSYDLLGFAVDLIRHMPRSARPVVGDRLRDECLAMFACIQAANMAEHKDPHLVELLRRLETANVLLRVLRDKRLISTGQYAGAVQLTGSIGKQATGWRKSASPASQQARLL